MRWFHGEGNASLELRLYSKKNTENSGIVGLYNDYIIKWHYDNLRICKCIEWELKIERYF